MRKFWIYTISLLAWSYFALSCFLFWVVSVLIFVTTAPFDRRRRWLHLYTCFWGFHYIWICPLWRTRIEGREHLRKGETYMIVANHQSLIDIPLLFGLFRHFKWVSKKTIFQVPCLGWNMSQNRYVALERGQRASIIKMMKECEAHLRGGSSILLFPEGTRSPDGEIQQFRGGAVALALRAGVPIVPIVVDGTRDALPKHGFLQGQQRRVRFRVRILAPVPTEGETDARELEERVRQLMRTELASMRKERGIVAPPEPQAFPTPRKAETG